MGGAGWVITQDTENGVGIATAWPLTYLVLNVKQTTKGRSAIPIGLAASTAACATIYGLEYFYFRQKDRDEAALKRRKRIATS